MIFIALLLYWLWTTGDVDAPTWLDVNGPGGTTLRLPTQSVCQRTRRWAAVSPCHRCHHLPSMVFAYCFLWLGAPNWPPRAGMPRRDWSFRWWRSSSPAAARSPQRAAWNALDAAQSGQPAHRRRLLRRLPPRTGHDPVVVRAATRLACVCVHAACPDRLPALHASSTLAAGCWCRSRHAWHGAVWPLISASWRCSATPRRVSAVSFVLVHLLLRW